MKRPTYTQNALTRRHPLFDTQDPTETLILAETQAATPFHMPAYLLGTPERIYLLNTGEVCQTQYDPADKRHAWFVKNGNSEEFAVFGGAVWRFTDTSPNEQEYYQLWRTTGAPGAKWCPEYWGIGEPYLRECEVRFFNKANGKPSRPRYVDVTYLEIIAHHPTKGFPGGIAIQDVLELAWYSSPAAKLERYWYAKDWGLVGFSNVHGFASYVTKKEFTPAPVRKLFTGVKPMVIPLEPEPEVNPIPEGYEEYILNTKDNMRIREPGLLGVADPQGRIVFLVPVGSRLRAQKSSLTKPDGQPLEWVRVIYHHVPETGTPATYRGWMGILSTFDDQFKPLPPVENPPPPKPDEPPPPPAPTPTPTPETPEQMMRRVIREEVERGVQLEREENARFAELLVNIFASMQAVSNSVNNQITLNLQELRSQVENYKQGKDAA